MVHLQTLVMDPYRYSLKIQFNIIPPPHKIGDGGFDSAKYRQENAEDWQFVLNFDFIRTAITVF
jgi:hypothetical protein